ncbi:unnamed protein product [Caenorhabditis brenneri]
MSRRFEGSRPRRDCASPEVLDIIVTRSALHQSPSNLDFRKQLDNPVRIRRCLDEAAFGQVQKDSKIWLQANFIPIPIRFGFLRLARRDCPELELDLFWS